MDGGPTDCGVSADPMADFRLGGGKRRVLDQENHMLIPRMLISAAAAGVIPPSPRWERTKLQCSRLARTCVGSVLCRPRPPPRRQGLEK